MRRISKKWLQAVIIKVVLEVAIVWFGIAICVAAIRALTERTHVAVTMLAIAFMIYTMTECVEGVKILRRTIYMQEQYMKQNGIKTKEVCKVIVFIVIAAVLLTAAGIEEIEAAKIETVQTTEWQTH